jgi:hypothetical protein
MVNEFSKRRTPLKPAEPNALKHKCLSDRLDGLAGMAWAYSALHYSGKSARALGIHFTPVEHLITDRYGNSADSGIFGQYLKGLRKPQLGPRGKHGVDLVAAVGNESYGNKANFWLNHALWKIFSRDVSNEDLEAHLDERKVPLCIVSSLYSQDFSNIPPDEAPRILRGNDFLYVCAMYRSFHKAGSWSAIAPLIRYLLPQVCSFDPIFGYIHAPFLRMLEDFYFKTDEQVLAARPVDGPPCVDPDFSDVLIPEDGPCPLNGKGKAKHVCERCEGGGGAPELDWST